MLGSAIIGELIKSFENVVGISRHRNDLYNISQHLGDLTNRDFLTDLKRRIKPDVIVHTAAIVDLSFCERNPVIANEVNARVPGELASMFPKAKFLYISTDSVFDGVRGNYNESDTANPMNQYAISKFNGELAVTTRDSDAVVLRMNIYGRKRMLGNSLAEWTVKSLQTEKVIQGYTNVFFNPLHIQQAAEAVCSVIGMKGASGIYHLGCKEKISKFEFLVHVAQTFGFNSGLIQSIDTSATTHGIRRPLNTTLDASKFAEESKLTFTLSDGLISLKQSFDNYMY